MYADCSNYKFILNIINTQFFYINLYIYSISRFYRNKYYVQKFASQ